jgi:hypothetical protein
MEKNINECRAGRLLKQLPAKESEALLKSIDDVDTSLNLLSRVLLDHGHDIHRKTLLRHRKRGTKNVGCVCPL